MNKNSLSVYLLYRTKAGRCFLQLILATHFDRFLVDFLRSAWSKPLIMWYAKHHGIILSDAEKKSCNSFQEFFTRKRELNSYDDAPDHMISPCDGWMSVYPISENCSFSIKGSHYRINDLLQDDQLAKNYIDGNCLVFRLSASDYHHYCYIDNCYQGSNHFIEGQLHSVQPIACEKYPVYVLNRRSWCLITTENFGPVVQTEIGALIVGGIINPNENVRCIRGSEKGHFELAGSTIVLLFQPQRISLRPELEKRLAVNKEIRVQQGMWIADRINNI